VTTIDAAAARTVDTRIALAALAALLGSVLGGCETSMNLFGTTSGVETQSITQTPPSAEAAKPRVAIALAIGAPDPVAKQLSALLIEAMEKQRIPVAKPGAEKAEFTVRGYVVAARERTSIKVSYIWDVTDVTGKRVNRITGEEMVPAGQTRDPWTAVTPQVLQTIAAKTATSLGTWLPSQPQGATAGSGAAPAGVGGHGTQASATAPAVREAALRSQPGTGPATGSIGRDGPLSAIVPSVTGAPGDGSVSLTKALQRELSRNGVALADRATGEAYRVEGKVILGQGQDGKQPVQIDWLVKDPQGKKLGTVSQKNEIDEGSLDGAWGQTADAAAAAAAKGILKLLPQPRAIN